jgi:hypothetical protein
MATESSYSIAPLSPGTWPAFDALVQRHNTGCRTGTGAGAPATGATECRHRGLGCGA